MLFLFVRFFVVLFNLKKKVPKYLYFNWYLSFDGDFVHFLRTINKV